MANIARDWLTGPRDYISGVEILVENNKVGPALLSLLKSGETAFTRKKLTTAIEALAKEAEVDNIPVEPIQRSKAIIAYDPLKLPTELKDVHIRKGQVYKQAAELRAKLFGTLTKAERCKICLQVVSLKKEHSALWDELNFFLSTGKVMPKEQVKQVLPDLQNMSVRELVDFIKNNPTRISKWGKQLITETDMAKRVELTELIKTHKGLQVEANRIIDSI